MFTLERAPAVSAALRVALDGELDRVREPLSLLAECLWWLSESKLFRRTRSGTKASTKWKPGRPVRASELLQGELTVDVHALVGDVERGDESARVTSVATRTVVDAVNKGALVVADEARSGRKHVEVSALAKEVRAHLERAERAAERAAAAVAREIERAKSAERERRERVQREKREREERVVREARAREEREREERAKSERAKKSAGRKKAKATSFGGLPDDAVPEDRTQEREVLSARGLTADAEFFLTEAALGWPCEGRSLDAARKALLLRFHPDRAGEAGVEKFQRAMRGYHSLVRALEKLGATARPAEHGSRVAAAHATQPPLATRPVVSEPPIAPRARDESSEKPREENPHTDSPAGRRSRVARDASAAEPKRRKGEGGASAQPVRGAAVGEWPPRARTH